MATALTVNVHIGDETKFESIPVSDFVSLRVDSDLNLFLLTSDQALKLYKAVGDAYIILHSLEAKRIAQEELATIKLDNNKGESSVGFRPLQ